MSRSNRLSGIARKALLVNLLPPDLVDAGIPLERARELFSTYVDQVEIENHHFCNRVCWFCPNTFLDRRTGIERMTDAVFARIVSDLASIDYEGVLAWSRYHEALADPSIFERLAAARERLPRATLFVISNGDYMNRQTLPRLIEAGIDRLIIDLYLPEGKERDPKAIAAGVARFERRTGISLVQGGPYDYSAETPSGTRVTLDIPAYTPDFVSTRGGLVDVPKRHTYRRRAVCVAPVRHVVIDWNGKGVLCCQTRSDAPQHASAVIGDLSGEDYGLFHLYRDMGAARRGLLAPGEKGGVCLTCDVRDDGPDRLARRDALARAVHAMPGAEALASGLWQRLLRKRIVVD